MCPTVSGVSLVSPTSSSTSDYTRFLPLIPNTPLSHAALMSVALYLPDAILNHSLRVYLYAALLANREASALSTRTVDLLFVASIYHDIGTTSPFNGSERFEVEGADAAVAFLRSRSTSGEVMTEEELYQVWTAIALHTSPGIAEKIDKFTRWIRSAVLGDFVPRKMDELGIVEYADEIEEKVPRLGIEKVLGDAVVGQALENEEKAPPASWAGVLLRSHKENPAWDGVNKAF